MVVGTVVWAGPKGAKVQLLDSPHMVGFMPSREAPFVIRDFEDELVNREVCVRVRSPVCAIPARALAGGGERAQLLAHSCCSSSPSPCPTPAPPRRAPPLQGPCLPKGLVRPFKIINVPAAGVGKAQTGPLLSARLSDLDVLWQRAAQLCDVSVQVGAAAMYALPC